MSLTEVASLPDRVIESGDNYYDQDEKKVHSYGESVFAVIAG